MTIPRFSLYSETDHWKGDIVEDPEGRWVRWKDVAAYILYGHEHGFAPEQEVPSPTPLREVMVDDDILPEEIDLLETEFHLDETEDLYDVMTKRTRGGIGEVED